MEHISFVPPLQNKVTKNVLAGQLDLIFFFACVADITLQSRGDGGESIYGPTFEGTGLLFLQDLVANL